MQEGLNQHVTPILLFSSKSIMKYLFIVFFLIFISCKKDDKVYSLGNEDGAQLSSLIHVSNISKIQVQADSLTTTTIEISINPEADSIAKNILLTTSLGTFPSGSNKDTLRANSYGIAKVDLLSNVFGTAMITVQSKSIVVDTNIVFQQSLPDDILMVADKYVGNNTDTFIITTSLFRNPGRGQVSDPVKIFYVITPENPNSPALVYPQFSFSTTKKSTITILNPLKGKGNYKIEAKTVSANNDTLSRNISIKIQ